MDLADSCRLSGTSAGSGSCKPRAAEEPEVTSRMQGVSSGSALQAAYLHLADRLGDPKDDRSNNLPEAL
eukprot:scaffold412336_cov48-Prasinocladus_malaysianus.AAC.1